MSEEIKKTLFSRIIDGAPKSLWILLAFICLIPLCLSLSLNMAHIRVDDYANGLLKIALMKAERQLTLDSDTEKLINSLQLDVVLIKEEFDQYKQQTNNRLLMVETLAHESGVQ